MQHETESQQRPTSPPVTPISFDGIRVLKRLHRRAVEGHHSWAVNQLERIAAEVLLHEFTRASDLLGSVSKLYEIVADMDQSAVGRLTSSYDGEGTRNKRRVDGKTHAISKRADVDDRIAYLLQRRHLQSFIIQCGESGLLEQLRVGCKACRHSRVREIDAMLREGTTVRDVAYWTARHNEPISKSTIHTHRRHVLLPHELAPHKRTSVRP